MADVPAQPGFGHIRIGEAFRFGWEGFKHNIGPLAIAAVVVFVVTSALNLVAASVDGLARFLVQAIAFFVGQVIAMGWLRMSLRVRDGQQARVEDLFQRADLFIPYVIASFVFSLMVTVGLILLVIPGVYLALTFGFYGYRVVDAERAAFAALGDSADLTRGHKGELLGYFLLALLLNIAGLLVFIVGVLVTSAVTLLATAHMYRQLQDLSPTV